MNKTCSICNILKLIEEYPKKGKQCKSCIAIKQKEYYNINKEKINNRNKENYNNNKEKRKDKNKEYRENNKEKISMIKKEYRENNKEKIKIKNVEYYQQNKNIIKNKNKDKYITNKDNIKNKCNMYYHQNKERILILRKNHRENNKEKNKIYNKNYRENNKNKIKIYNVKYYKNNKEKMLEYHKKYHKNKYDNDLKYNIIIKIRGRLRNYLQSLYIKKIKNHNTTADTIGLSKLNFLKWIKYNLDLDNITKNDDYHLDHFIPLSSFKCKSIKDIIESKCNNWANIRPILAINNLKKSNKIPSYIEKIKMELRIYIFKKAYNIPMSV
jgi:hypothetical protein